MEPEIFHEGWMIKSPPQKRSSHGYPLIKKVTLLSRIRETSGASSIHLFVSLRNRLIVNFLFSLLLTNKSYKYQLLGEVNQIDDFISY